MIIPFGEHRGELIGDVPEPYLRFVVVQLDEGALKDRITDYLDGIDGALNEFGPGTPPGQCRECGAECSEGSDYCDPCYLIIAPTVHELTLSKDRDGFMRLIDFLPPHYRGVRRLYEAVERIDRDLLNPLKNPPEQND